MPKKSSNDYSELFNKIHRLEKIMLMDEKFAKLVKLHDEKEAIYKILNDTEVNPPFSLRETLNERLKMLHEECSKLYKE